MASNGTESFKGGNHLKSSTMESSGGTIHGNLEIRLLSFPAKATAIPIFITAKAEYAKLR